MKYTEALTQLLKEHERQAKDPSLWQDNPLKMSYYGLFNKVYDKLEEIDKLEEVKQQIIK